PHFSRVRNLSTGAAWHLRQLLDRVRPKLVLIEGSDDADDLIQHIVSPKSTLPIAILAYTAEAPVRTFVYPLATYSPEYQALLWCRENKVKARFMDLPSAVFLGLMDPIEGTMTPDSGEADEEDKEDETAPEKEDEDNESPEDEGDEQAEEAPIAEPKRKRESVYEQLARLSGEPDYETYW